MTKDLNDWWASYQAEQQKRAAQLPVLKNALLDELTRQGIASVTISYDGEGDSGQIQDIEAFSPGKQPVALPDTLREQVDEFTWEVLALHHDGYENNDGGFGQMTIVVAERCVELDHNDRVMESVNTTTEV